MANPNTHREELLRMAERAIRECYPEFAEEILTIVIAPDVRSYQLEGPDYNSHFTILENALAKYEELKPEVQVYGPTSYYKDVRYYDRPVTLTAIYKDKIMKRKRAPRPEEQDATSY
jgi:hypothetical protein